MSGILGIYRFDGASVSEKDLEMMLQKLKHRGPDGVNRWQSGPVGLGHCMLQTTPESLFEALPSQQQNCVITADARIDNREELYELISIAQKQPLDRLADSDLILLSYQQWGESCVDYLLGDFVFAIWDSDRQHLFCARDHFGLRPFYYHLCDDFFAFASEAKSLLALPDVSGELNEERIADYLISNFSDKESTSFLSIRRLAPANYFTLTQGSHTLKTYWHLDQKQELCLESDEAYSQKFLEIFTEAVRCRLRSAYPIASTLSGGLDSSSVTCIARKILAESGVDSLTTISGIFSSITQCDESEFIDAVILQGGIQPNYFYPEQKGPLSDIESFLWHQDEPSPGLGDGAMVMPMYAALREQGVRVLLGGIDGDTTVSHGLGYLQELARANNWLQLYKESKGIAKIYDDQSGFSYFFSYFWPYFLISKLGKNKAQRLVNLGRRVRRFFMNFFKKNSISFSIDAILNKEFKEKINLEGRKKEAARQGFTVGEVEREVHFSTVNQGLQSFSIEIMNKTASAFSIEERCPFWDKRLVEFCLSLPANQKLRNGWTRLILRQSMAGILPEKIRWRQSKTDFMPNVYHGLISINRTRLETLFSQEMSPSQSYLNLKAVNDLYLELLDSKVASKNPSKVISLCHSTCLSIWLWQLSRDKSPITLNTVSVSTTVGAYLD